MMILLCTVLFLLLGILSSADSSETGDRFGYELLAARLQSLENVYFSSHLKTLDSIQSLRHEISQSSNERCNIHSNGRKESNTFIYDIPSSCVDVQSKKSGIYTINYSKGFGKPLDVYCEQEIFGGGWIVFQNRVKGNVNFYRPWNEYKEGFGSIDGDFWLGLEKLHEITYSDNYELAIVLQDYSGESVYARYAGFAVGSEAEMYELNKLGIYSGNASDSLSYHLKGRFSTFDKDNDSNPSGNCAINYVGAWWYGSCHQSNLNSIYPLESEIVVENKFMVWRKWKGDLHKLKSSRMMIRRTVSN